VVAHRFGAHNADQTTSPLDSRVVPGSNGGNQRLASELRRWRVALRVASECAHARVRLLREQSEHWLILGAQAATVGHQASDRIEYIAGHPAESREQQRTLARMRDLHHRHEALTMQAFRMIDGIAAWRALENLLADFDALEEAVANACSCIAPDPTFAHLGQDGATTPLSADALWTVAQQRQLVDNLLTDDDSHQTLRSLGSQLDVIVPRLAEQIDELVGRASDTSVHEALLHLEVELFKVLDAIEDQLG
jgi:hypothetical protein